MALRPIFTNAIFCYLLAFSSLFKIAFVVDVYER